MEYAVYKVFFEDGRRMGSFVNMFASRETAEDFAAGLEGEHEAWACGPARSPRKTSTCGTPWHSTRRAASTGGRSRFTGRIDGKGCQFKYDDTHDSYEVGSGIAYHDDISFRVPPDM